uniref:autotransporter outer membrane beta-barrel domain-containing protein n=1 Tax=Escherichia coli TaxID=562 RepID=UPI00189A672B
GYHQTNQKTDTGKTLTRWPVLVDHNSTQFSFTKNFSAYTDANYLGGGDVDQDWSANVGVKYTW